MPSSSRTRADQLLQRGCGPPAAPSAAACSCSSTSVSALRSALVLRGELLDLVGGSARGAAAAASRSASSRSLAAYSSASRLSAVRTVRSAWSMRSAASSDLRRRRPRPPRRWPAATPRTLRSVLGQQAPPLRQLRRPRTLASVSRSLRRDRCVAQQRSICSSSWRDALLRARRCRCSSSATATRLRSPLLDGLARSASRWSRISPAISGCSCLQPLRSRSRWSLRAALFSTSAVRVS